MNTDIAVRDQAEFTVLSNDQLQYIAGTEFVPPGLRGNLPAILACVATGRALGLADMTALRSIHIIDGKATFSAELMVQLVRRQGHSITGEVSEGSATVVGKRADNGDTISATWTLQMAERAGLLNKQNWRKYPEAMLWARAASQLCRMLFADCFAGATYTPEELENSSVAPAGGVEGSVGQSADAAHGAIGDAGQEVGLSTGATSLATKAQKKKLDVLVGQLRDAGRITTEDVWEFLGKQNQMGDAMDSTMVVHWSPLRELLSKDEASFLIDTLERFSADPDAVWAAGSSSTNEEPQAVDRGTPVSHDAAGEADQASSRLTMTELVHKVKQAGVAPEQGSAVLASLYPGRKSSELTDQERAVFWAELESSIAERVA